MDGIALIGFGEAGRAFAGAPGWTVTTRVYDRRDDSGVHAALAAAGLTAEPNTAAAVRDAAAVISLVTAGQALPVATLVAADLAPGAVYLDCNSVAPATKRAAARAVTTAGGRYVDVGVMAPVLPTRLGVPLLVAGPDADVGATYLHTLGFTAVEVIGGEVGRAAAVKMIRSVMAKGIEALTVECLLAGAAAGVVDAVIASLDANQGTAGWRARGDYNLDRMMVHGVRRAEEMDEVVATLDALGTGSAMSRATWGRQAEIGGRRLAPPAGLDAKLAALLASAGPARAAA